MTQRKYGKKGGCVRENESERKMGREEKERKIRRELIEREREIMRILIERARARTIEEQRKRERGRF